MAALVSVEADGVAVLAARMAGSPEVVGEELGVGVARLTIAGQGEAREASPVDVGILRNAWSAEARGLEGTIRNATAYARPVNDGRAPGSPMPPEGALSGWMARHGIPAEAEFALRRSIARRGIPARRMRERAIAKVVAEAPRELAAAARRVAARLTGAR